MVLVVVVVIFAAATARIYLWPALPAIPAHVDAIIELGGPGDRDGEALALARSHLAPVVVQSTTVADSFGDSCLPAVDGVEVLCFHADPGTTRGEAQWIGQEAARLRWHSVVLVTTPDQAWRARLRVTRCFPGQVYVATTPLPVLDWFTAIPYQWSATIRAELFERDC